jgi:hypothetical protein
MYVILHEGKSLSSPDAISKAQIGTNQLSIPSLIPAAITSFLDFTTASPYFSRSASLTNPLVTVDKSVDLRKSRIVVLISASEGPGRKGTSSSELSKGDSERTFGADFGFGFDFFGFDCGVVLAFFLGGSSKSSSSSSSSTSSSSSSKGESSSLSSGFGFGFL